MGKPGAGTVEGNSPGLLEESLVLRVEPIRGAAGVPSEPGSPASLTAPDLIEPIVAFRSWRAIDDRLRSPYLPVFWDERILAARCRRARHVPPRPGCGCGINAYREPNVAFPTVDYRGVTGIVTLWGMVEIRPEGLRSEFARVEALGFYSRWSNRQQAAVRTIADRLGVELVDHDNLEAAANLYGERLHAPSRQSLPLPA
jgi:hypothetical protein